MARVIVNVPAPAKRGEVIEIRTLVGHVMETGFRRTQTGELIPRDIIPASSAPTTARRCSAPNCPSGDRRQSAHQLHHRRHRERDAGIPLDRRQRLLRDRIGRDHRRVMTRSSSVLAALFRHGRGGDPPRRPPLGLRVHGPRDARHAGRRRDQSGHALGAGRRGALEPQGRRPPGRPAPIAMAEKMKGVAARFPAFDASGKN